MLDAFLTLCKSSKTDLKMPDLDSRLCLHGMQQHLHLCYGTQWLAAWDAKLFTDVLQVFLQCSVNLILNGACQILLHLM